MKYYLAYGSNLNIEQMAERCPTAVVIGKTTLKDYRLTFRGNYRGCGVANIEPRKGSSVPVGIWSIEDRDEKNLDFYEGYPRLYEKVFLNVEVNGQALEVMAYVMTPGHPWAAPYLGYYKVIHTGYDDFKFTNEERGRLTYAYNHPLKGVNK